MGKIVDGLTLYANLLKAVKNQLSSFLAFPSHPIRTNTLIQIEKAFAFNNHPDPI